MSRRVITFGTFDLFHIGHLNILQNAASLGDYLIVGISSDELNYHKKGFFPTVNFTDRARIIAALACVQQVFKEESLEQKAAYIQRYAADVLVMGDDWAGIFDIYSDLCEVRYFPRTPEISTTEIVNKIKER
ncbi:MAG: adenylyltransferase/cytidyltransferase family protein [Gammaproteobacteria bacterium]|nr:adenylyltransferase/cytidyltransferase family protein [Gammaproteobacteria bacterium]